MAHGSSSVVAVLAALILSAPALHASSDQTPLTKSGSSCDGIASLYASCSKKFDYDGHAFYFKLSEGPRTALCDDGRKLVYYDRMDDMDIASILSIPYLKGLISLPEVRRNWDPGRLRNEDLLKAVYGSNESAARAKLVKVSFLNQSVMFSSQLGAANALSNAGRQMQALAKTDSEVATFLKPFLTGKNDLKGNTFFWRKVKGTPRLSAHSFGAAIDILTNVGPMYWLWDEQRDHPARAKLGEQAYRNIHYIPPGAPRFNQKVVDVMEANGFVWGGKWNHYDTMHFEYRPELTGMTQAACLTLTAATEFQRPTAQDFADAESRHPRDHD